MKLVFLAAMLTIAAVPSAAQVTPTIVAPAPVKTVKPAKKICERVEETGTRLGGRQVCLTAEEWQARRANDRRETERVQQKTGYKPAG